MAKGHFTNEGVETYNPQYGEVEWKRRLNNWAEENDVDLRPVYYHEDGKPKMQVTQENTAVMLNMFADEMDCIVVNYDEDINEEEAFGTYYFRERFGNDEEFKSAIHVLGGWAMMIMTIYPDEDLVEVYEQLHQAPDEIPDDWPDN